MSTLFFCSAFNERKTPIAIKIVNAMTKRSKMSKVIPNKSNVPVAIGAGVTASAAINMENTPFLKYDGEAVFLRLLILYVSYVIS
jgi:hypothetical protein